MISVILCMYNAEKYILKQLESIMLQTMTPDVVEIFDDCSTDSSICVVKKFIKDNKLDNYIITINQQNKGWRRNFFDAIIKHENDEIIFFSDHDDIWNLTKIEVMVNIVRSNSNILRLSGEQIVIDKDDKVFSPKNIKTCKSKFNYKVQREQYFKNIPCRTWQYRLGCAMCITGRFAKTLKDFGFFDKFSHDNWAAFVSSICNGGYTVNFPAIKYRVHSQNASSPDLKTQSIKNGREQRLKVLKSDFEIMSRYVAGIENSIKSFNIKELKVFKKKIELLKTRISYIENKKYLRIVLLFMRYVCCGEVRGFVGDMLSLKQKENNDKIINLHTNI